GPGQPAPAGTRGRLKLAPALALLRWRARSLKQLHALLFPLDGDLLQAPETPASHVALQRDIRHLIGDANLADLFTGQSAIAGERTQQVARPQFGLLSAQH